MCESTFAHPDGLCHGPTWCPPAREVVTGGLVNQSVPVAPAEMYDDACIIHAEQKVAAAQWTGKHCQQGGSSRMGPFQRLVRRGRWGCRPSEEADSGSTDLGQPL